MEVTLDDHAVPTFPGPWSRYPAVVGIAPGCDRSLVRRRDANTGWLLVKHPNEDHDIRPNHEPDAERIATAHLRQPPAFMIIGTQKGGTTSLHHYLNRHPDVCMAFKKEVHFFDTFYAKGIDWYRAHFPLLGEVAQTGEASPSYLFHPKAAERAHDAYPQMKLIALLRNPVDRAYSHHQMEVRRENDSLSFEEAIAEEPRRLHNSDPDMPRGSWRRYSYVSRGLYAQQLERWLKVFPREHLLIIKSEEFSREPERIFDHALRFLGLPSHPLPEYPAHRSGTYVEMQPETRARLARYYEPYNRQLYALVGRDFGWDD